MSEYDEKRDQEERTDVEGHLRRNGAERIEEDGEGLRSRNSEFEADDDTPDFEGHVKRNSPVEHKPKPRPA